MALRPAEEGAVTGSDRLPAHKVAELFGRWSPDIRRFLWALTRNADVADDLAQVTFSRLVESGQGIQPGAERAWLFRVAHNEAMLWRRRNGVKARGLRRVAEAGALNEQVEPWQRLVNDEDAARVRRALAELPPEQRHVVEQRIDAGQTFNAIAKELNKPIGTVLTRMRLALAKLERALRDP